MQTPQGVKSALVDARNIIDLAPQIVAELQNAAAFVGFDIETQDADRHEGLNRAMKVNEDGFKSSATKLLFDINRTTITGFSIYVDGSDTAYYFNLNHADVENRLAWEAAKLILESKNPDAYWIAHNAPFEIVMMMCYGFDLGEKIICSMQLCVSAYNADEYPLDKFYQRGLGGIEKLIPIIARAFSNYIPGTELSAEQEELLFKVIGKESDAAHSYNGYVGSIAYGYGLKQAVHSWFDYQMTTFEETLRGRPHMGCLTGEEVVDYGADDAYWAVKLYHRVMEHMIRTNPGVVATFFQQENPMVRVYAETWMGGLRLNHQAVLKRRDMERHAAAETLRRMKVAIQQLLPFPDAPHEKLMKYDPKWFPKNFGKYRNQITTWANLPDAIDDFSQCIQARSPVSNAWALERSVPESKGVNLVHYMPMRTILYDLCGCSYQQHDGKTQSDGDAREVMRERWVKKHFKEYPELFNEKGEVIAESVATNEQADILVRYHAVLEVLDCYSELSGIDQRVKLYITPYLNLVDPDTGRVYPILSSKLNTRRMACQHPNGQQLAKYGESAYVRGFFQADEDAHVIVSADFSAVELVIIGEYSNDPGFKEAYGQRPHRDLHKKAVLGCMVMTNEEYEARTDKKELRRDVGKAANFNYWFSGALGTVGDKLGWSSDRMWEAVDGYRATFAIAEQWRVDSINEGRINGFFQLPDGHRRSRFESTPQWAGVMRDKWRSYGLPQLEAFGDLMIRKLQTRAGNQGINAMVQGLCATLTKRKILRMRRMIAEKGYRARLMIAIHDELVVSVHRDDALDFMDDLYQVMIEDEGLFKHMVLDSSLAIGRTMQPWDKEAAPDGQVELMELNKGLPCIPKDRWEQKATRAERKAVLDYLFDPASVHIEQEAA